MRYVPGFKGTSWVRTPVQHLLEMIRQSDREFALGLARIAGHLAFVQRHCLSFLKDISNVILGNVRIFPFRKRFDNRSRFFCRSSLLLTIKKNKQLFHANVNASWFVVKEILFITWMAYEKSTIKVLYFHLLFLFWLRFLLILTLFNSCYRLQNLYRRANPQNYASSFFFVMAVTVLLKNYDTYTK